jgi:predicted ATPase
LRKRFKEFILWKMSHAARTQVTVLFSELARAADPPVSVQFEEILARHGKTSLRRVGQATLAVFAGSQDGDEAARAVRAALEIQAQFAEKNPTALPPKIGIHTTTTPAGEPAADDVKLAERIHAAAPAGGVLISQATYRHVYGLIDVKSLPPLRMDNLAKPIQTHLALRVRPRSLARTLRGVEEDEIKMVGRESELDILTSAFRAAAERRELRMVTILGEAGIGKSRLLREFQRWLQVTQDYRASLFWGRAEPETAAQPFALIRDVFRSRFEIPDSDPLHLAREKFERGLADLLANREGGAKFKPGRIGQLLGFDFSATREAPDLLQESQPARHQIFQNVGDLFAFLGSAKSHRDAGGPTKRAVVLVLDDLQWSDDDSLDLVTHLAKNFQGAPLMILTLARPALLERRPAWRESLAGHQRMDLEPLSSRESEMLVEAIMSQSPEVPAAIRETILADAGGNPFYIEEIIKVLLDKKVILPEAGGWRFDAHGLATMPMSATLRGVLRARLEGLPMPEREVIQCASVVGHVFWDSAIESLSRTGSAAKSALAEILAGLCRKDLIHRRESSGFAGAVEFIFKHELLRDVAFESLPKQVRRDHHARVAAWFAEHIGDRIREFAGLVAVHFERAGQLAEAADWYGQAGDQAWNSFAPGAAIEYFQKAISLFPSAPPGKCLKWHEGLSNVLTTEGRFNEALASYGKVCALAETTGDSAAQARAWNGIAYLHERCADNRASIAAAGKSEALARLGGAECGDELIRALYLKGWACYRLSDAPAVLALAAQTLQLCEQFGRRRWMASSYKLYGVANLQLGHYPEADHYFEKALALSHEFGDRRNAGAMFSNLGESARLRGDFARAAELYQKALEVAREIGDRPSEMIYLNNLGGARLGLAQFREAETDLRQAIAITGVPKTCSLAETYSFLALACLGQQKLPAALEAAQQAVVIGQQTENPLELAGAWRTLGQVLAALARTGGVENASVQRRWALPFSDGKSCLAESLRIYEAIGAAKEQTRTLQMVAEFEHQNAREKSSKANRKSRGT